MDADSPKISTRIQAEGSKRHTDWGGKQRNVFAKVMNLRKEKSLGIYKNAFRVGEQRRVAGYKRA